MKIFKKGISMMVLVITIVVMIILAGTVILVLQNTNIIEKGNLAKIESDLSALKEEVKLKRGQRELKDEDIKGTYKLSEWEIESSTYEDVSVIAGGELRIKNTGKNDYIEKAAEELDILLKSDNYVIKNTTGSNLVNYKIYGNSKQNGEPSPDNPLDIQSLGTLVTDKKDINYGKYKISLKVDGKNLLDCSKMVKGAYTKDLAVSENSFTFKRTSTKNTSSAYVDMYLEKGIYLISGDVVQSDGNNGGYGVYDLESKKYLINDSAKNITTKIINIQESKIYRIAFFCNYSSNDSTSVTFSNVMIQKSKNLINVYEYYKKYLDGNNDINYTQNQFVEIKNIEIPVNAKENTSYTFSLNYEIYASNTQSGNGIIMLMLDKDKNIVTKKQITSKGSAVTGTASLSNDTNKKIEYVTVSYVTSTRDCKVKLSNLSLIENDSFTEYEPYKEQKTYNIYLKEPLRRVGESADYIDFSQKKVVRNVQEETLTNVDSMKIYMCGSKWQKEGATSVYIHSYLKKSGLKQSVPHSMSNRFKESCINNTSWEWVNCTSPYNYVLCGASSSASTANHLYLIIENKYLNNISDTSSDTEKINAVREYLKNNTITICYGVASFAEEKISLPSIATFRGTTTLSLVDENKVSASNIEVEY